VFMGYENRSNFVVGNMARGIVRARKVLGPFEPFSV